MKNTYDEYAQQYEAMLSSFGRSDEELASVALAKAFFEVIGDVSGQRVLDAGCGEGFVSRVLETRGASVVGVDISPRLIERAISKGGPIDYRVADLSDGLPEFHEHFDIVASYFVLNDVPDFRGFIRTISLVTKPTGRAIMAFNNPYSAVLREKADSYFDSGSTVMYQGMASAGVKVYHYHRTMGEYINTFTENGFLLRSLSEPEPGPEESEDRRERWNRVPFQVVTEFVRDRATSRRESPSNS